VSKLHREKNWPNVVGNGGVDSYIRRSKAVVMTLLKQ